MSEEIYPLSKPITAHGEEVTSLTLKKLGPSDARALKALPYYIAADESVRIDVDVGAKFIVKMAGIPMSSVDQLDLADLNALCWKVAGFFLSPESERTTSSGVSSTTFPTSGA